MYGNISVGIVTIEMPPRITINNPITTKVYGRRNASLTIHIMSWLKQSHGQSPGEETAHSTAGP